MRTAIFAVALPLLFGCVPESGSVSQRVSMAFSATHSNVSEFDGKVNIPVSVTTEDGATRVEIGYVSSWPISNEFLGFDKFYYNASEATNPIVRIQDEGCDEAVVNGEACGWRVNRGSCVGDGFGCFGSLASMEPAGLGGRSGPLAFYLAGDANLLPNDHGSRVALHARFGDDCSGWFSDGISSGLGSDPSCESSAEPRICVLTVAPSPLNILRGEFGTAVISVSVSGPEPKPGVSLSTSAAPFGTSLSLQPSLVVPPVKSSILTVQTSENTPLGASLLNIKATGRDEYGDRFSCETPFSLNVFEVPPEPGVCGCP